MVLLKFGVDMMPGFTVSFACEGGVDLVEGDPAEFADFAVLLNHGLMRVTESGGEDNYFFVDLAIFNNVRKTVTDGFVDIDVEASFFFDFAEGGLDFGLAGFDMTFGETPVVVGLMF